MAKLPPLFPAAARFVGDSPLEEAVSSEPVSEIGISDNARFREVYSTFTGSKAPVLGSLSAEFFQTVPAAR